MKYIVVAYVPDPHNREGTLTSLVGDDKFKLIRQMLVLTKKWTDYTAREYRILVGELSEEVLRPPVPDYSIVAIDE